MADSRALEYAKKLDELVRQAKKPTAEAQRAIEKLLSDMSREILGDIAKTDPASYSAQRLKELKAAVDRAAQEFSRDASSKLASIQQQTYSAATATVDSTVSAATGGVLVHPIIDTKALQIVQGYSADLISGISREASTKINLAIQRAYMGGADLTTLVNQVGSALENGKFTGIFSAVGDRAVTIATNEVMRVHSLASQARIEDLAEHHPELGKQWKHIPAARVPRISHLLADGQVRKASEPYDVGGEDLMYPRDPSGSAENTINCHCLSMPHLPPEALKPTDSERSLLNSLGISVSTSRI